MIIFVYALIQQGTSMGHTILSKYHSYGVKFTCACPTYQQVSRELLYTVWESKGNLNTPSLTRRINYIWNMFAGLLTLAKEPRCG